MQIIEVLAVFLYKNLNTQKEDGNLKGVSQSISQSVATRIINELRARCYNATAINEMVLNEIVRIKR